MEIRTVAKDDISGLKEVLDSSELFPSELLDKMISRYLENPNAGDIWFTCIDNFVSIALGYYAPEKFTEGTYNLYAIGVRKELQGRGVGRKMMHFIEQLLSQASNRILLVETSSADQYKLTRAFYLKLGYRQEGIIHDFWKDGDDKVIF